MNDYFAGVDIGGTHIKTLLVDEQLNRCGFATVPTTADSVGDLVDAVTTSLDEAGREQRIDGADLALVGVGVPGQVDTVAGIVRHAVNLNIQEAPLAALLSEKIGCPVVIDNDVIMAARGAYVFLNPGEDRDFCYLNIGTGVSAGLILDGQLHRGHRGMAGEIGHMVLIDDGRLCPCGNRGCLEAYISGPAIAAAGRQAVANENGGSLADVPSSISAKAVYQAAAQGNPAARDIVTTAGRHLGRALQNLLMAYDVGQIVLGGGVSRSGNLFLRPILQEWATQAQRSPLAAMMLRPERLSLAPADFNTGAWGAAVAAHEAVAGKVAKTNQAPPPLNAAE